MCAWLVFIARRKPSGQVGERVVVAIVDGNITLQQKVPQSHATPPPKKEFLYRQKSALVRRGDGWHCWREIFFAGKEQSSLFFLWYYFSSPEERYREKELALRGGFFQRFKEIYTS